MEFLQTFGTMSPEEFQKKAIKDPNIMEIGTEQGHNILHACASMKNYKLLKFLSEQYDISGLVNQPIINGNTPLHLFFGVKKHLYSTNLDILKILLENGANLFLRNCRGETPFSIFQENLESRVSDNFDAMKMIYEETLNRGENNTDIISLYNWSVTEKEKIEAKAKEMREKMERERRERRERERREREQRILARIRAAVIALEPKKSENIGYTR